MKHLRWLLIIVCVAACLRNISRSVSDSRSFGGTDLRARVVGARALLRGINPYTLTDSDGLEVELRDPDQGQLSRCTYPPTLLAFYAPLAPLNYAVQRSLWMVLEWTALALSLAFLSLALRGSRVRFWYLTAAIGLVGGSGFWRLHVERGQYYVFVLLLLSMATWFTLKRRQAIPAGLLFGLAACLRPPVLLIVVPLWWTGRRRVTGTAVVTLAVCVTASVGWVGVDVWRDFVSLSRDWEIAILDGSFSAATEADGGGAIDGYRRTMLPSRTANMSMASFAQGLLPPVFTANPHRISILIKFCWAVLIAALFLSCYRGHRVRRMSDRAALLCGTAAMMITDYFLPIRIGYADVLFCLPLALIAPLLLQPKHRVLTGGLVLAFLLSAIPMHRLPWQVGFITTAFRSLVVVYITLRSVAIVFSRPESTRSS